MILRAKDRKIHHRILRMVTLNKKDRIITYKFIMTATFFEQLVNQSCYYRCWGYWVTELTILLRGTAEKNMMRRKWPLMDNTLQEAGGDGEWGKAGEWEGHLTLTCHPISHLLCPSPLFLASSFPLPFLPLHIPSSFFWQHPGGSDSKESACNAGYVGLKDPLEKEMTTHSSILYSFVYTISLISTSSFFIYLCIQ